MMFPKSMSNRVNCVIIMDNCGLNIDQNNRDYDFCHNRAALVLNQSRYNINEPGSL